MTPLTTILAELEEAERAASPGPWRCQMDKNNHRCLIAYDDTWSKDLTLGAVWSSINDEPPANARLIALMRTHLPALIEAVKRKGEALEPFAEKARWYRPDEAEYEIGGMIRVADLFAARAALKETTDVTD